METHEVLDIAEEDISDYCTSLYGDDENETSRCWTAYQYFEEQKAASEQGCELEIRDGVVHGVDCNRLESFESFIRELVKQGKVKNLVKTLATLAGAETRQKARNDAAEAEAEADAEAEGPRTVKALVAELDSEVPGTATPARKILRSVLLEVFDEHDYNKDGKMDVAEFRAAMQSLGDELSANTVRTIYQSLGATFFLTFEQFATVVEAEEIRAHSRFAKSLRTLARGSSKWWTEAPDH